MGKRGFNQKLDRLVVEYVEMLAIDPCDAAVAVAHVFAQTDIGDGDEVWAFRFNRSQHFLNDPVFCVGAACLSVFFFRNTEKQHRLQPKILSALDFIDNFLQG